MPAGIPSPSPAHIIRSHSAALSDVSFSDDCERLISADASGLVVVTSTRSLRSLASWKAHEDGVLGVQEISGYILTFVVMSLRILLELRAFSKSREGQQTSCVGKSNGTFIFCLHTSWRFCNSVDSSHAKAMLLHGCQCLELLSLLYHNFAQS